MKTKRLLALLMCAFLIICAIPFSASAADPEVLSIDGERTAFLGTFGKVNYNGKSYASYKTFADALLALGTEGGRIVLSGNVTVGVFNDIVGRAPITIVGIGANPRGNCVNFAGNPEINLGGDIVLGNLVIRTDAEAVILTNGYSLTTLAGFDTYCVEKYVADGDNIIEYIDKPSIAVGKADITSVLGVTNGKYAKIVAGAVNGHVVNGSSKVVIDGCDVENAIAGNFATGTVNGDVTLQISDGNVDKLMAGPESGVVNGNVMTIVDGGNIGEFVIGAGESATVNGNLVVSINSASYNNAVAGTGKITGKKVIVTGADVSVDNVSSFADYIIKIDGGNCIPVFDKTEVKGFSFTDDFGVPLTSIVLNGQNTNSDNGVFALPAGVSEIKITSSVSLNLNKNANYVNGYEDGTFRPQNNITRAEAITLLSRLIVDDSVIKGKIGANYDDVEAGAWYESYIGFFQNLGFLDNISRDYGLKIAPTENITRGEFTQLIYEISTATQDSPSVKLKSFTDVSSNHKYLTAINAAVSTGIVTGYDDGTFKPENSITRAEVVTMVNRFIGRIPNGVAGTNSFSDISGHWASSQILAACNDENVSWTAKSDGGKYVLSGTSAKDYMIGLYEQSATLSSEAIREGIEVVSDQIKKDILNAPDTLDISDRKVIYVSEKNGNDDNDGLTKETAIKTIAGLSKFKFLRNAAILFERGGIYRGQIVLSPNTYYGAYGEGPKPLLMQSRRNYADESLWVETEYPNVYKCTELLTNVGVIGFDHDLFDYSDASYDETYGLIMNKDLLGFTGVADMDTDLQFYSEFVDNNIHTACPLYVYSTEGNPGKRFSSIEIGERFDIIDGSPLNVIIENLAFKFTGAHAIGVNNANKFTVRNCLFSWLGGSILDLRFGTTGVPVNYGNAVETGVCNGYYVENNWMYQIYDTGPTHQVSNGTGTYVQRDVRYVGNLIEYVHWGIEFYNAPTPSEESKRVTDGVYTAYNICRYGGYGWGSIVRNRQTGAQLYSGHALGVNKNQHTEYNVFDRSAGNLIRLCSASTEFLDKNIYIQTLGGRLGDLKGTISTKCDYDADFNIKKHLGDNNAVVIVIDPEKEDPKQYNK
ncbi:MAG: hypothetical protein E7656_00635 [Ruminococcaceae bacterium]|nr:hypothetical protein [Oscillospiraceae bacterium]